MRGKLRFHCAALLLLAACQPQAPEQAPAVEVSPPPAAPAMPAMPATAPAPQATTLPASLLLQGPARIRALIPAKKALAQATWEAAGKINDETHVGTAFNELDAEEHACFILGNLLDRAQLVQHLESEYETDYTTATDDNALSLRLASISATNFAIAAERIVELSRDEWVMEWNLDCVNKLEIPADSGIAQTGRPTFYSIRDDGTLLQVLGDIDVGFSQQLIDAIEANPGVRVVALGSRGGLVGEALRAGLYIRQKGLDTTLWDGCYSACPLVFMGGNRRQIWSPYPVLGFHKISDANGVAVALDGPSYGAVHRYLLMMGIDPRYVLTRMWSAEPQGMTEVEGNEAALCNANVATWVQRGCTGPGDRSAMDR